MKLNDTCDLIPLNNNNSDSLCVLGVLDNNAGQVIKNELINWLSNKFQLFIVQQKFPGKLYEYPALNIAKQLSTKLNKNLLYVHTKGAFYPRAEAPVIRNIWKKLFNDKYAWCLNYLSKTNAMCCPFSGNSKIPWYNGFFADPIAWSKLNIIPNDNRWYYETDLFKPTDILCYGYYNNNLNNSNEMTNFMLQQILTNKFIIT